MHLLMQFIHSSTDKYKLQDVNKQINESIEFQAQGKQLETLKHFQAKSTISVKILEMKSSTPWKNLPLGENM